MPTICLTGSSAFVVNTSPQVPFVIRESSPKYGNQSRRLGPEAILHKAWRNAGLEQAEVRGRDGHNYRIMYGGKPGGSLGPDFTDAVVERDDGTTFRGDIEIHVRESDWRAHGHHNDPRYNGVVLHVVASESNGRPAIKATGSSIPLLALNWKKLNSRSVKISTEPDKSVAQHHRESGQPAKLRLDIATAGLERFHSQAAGIALDIEAFGADQALWLGVMGALGYPRNKRAFRALANRVDWSMAVACENSLDLNRLLTKASGLSDIADSNSTQHPQLRGSAPDWVKPFGRPANSPLTRIKSISELVPIWSKTGGITRHAISLVRSAPKPSSLTEMFRLNPDRSSNSSTSIGKARASEIVVNVFLPAVFAIATSGSIAQTESTSLRNRAIELYSGFPKLPENSLTREAEIALGIDYELPKITNARDQQGLIVLYREMIRNGIQTRQPRLPGV